LAVDAPGYQRRIDLTEEGNMLGTIAIVLAKVGDKGSDIDIGSIIGFVVVGAIVGVLARFLVPGDDPMGIIGTIVLGIVGAVIGGWAAGALFEDTAGVDWIASIVAAVILVLAWRALSSSRSGSRVT
jgi:uncharacterized membrane protein YeaQ/YmgE (transglycosylase-associated protein family)